MNNVAVVQIASNLCKKSDGVVTETHPFIKLHARLRLALQVVRQIMKNQLFFF